MADFSILKQQIAAALPENTEGEISATIMVALFWAAIDAINTAKADQGDLDALAGVVAGKMGVFGLDEYGGLKWITAGDAYDLSVDYEMVQATIPDLAEIRQNAASPLHWLTGEAQQVEEGRIYTGTGILAAPGEFEVIKCYAVNYTDTAQTITCWRYPDTASNAQTFTLAPFQVLALTCTIDEQQGSIWTASDSHYLREDKVFVATYGTTTAAEILAAYNAGKVVVCNYDNHTYMLSTTDSGGYIYLNTTYGAYLAYIRVNTTSNVWGSGSQLVEKAANRLIAAPSASDLASTDKYPSMKTAADYIAATAASKADAFVQGVVSQTQTWTLAADGGYDYVMSDVVTGNIPKVFVDIIEACGYSFNPVSGYFEANGLTDISYKDMVAIYAAGILPPPDTNYNYLYTGKPIRTNIPYKSTLASGGFGRTSLVSIARASEIESLALFMQNNNVAMSAYCSTMVTSLREASKLKRITNIIDLASNASQQNFQDAFTNCFSLEDIRIKGIRKDVSFADSPRLSNASILFAINNVGTETLTITLHATAYARAIADASITTALSNHPNVTLASA